MTPLGARIAALIETSGPISVSDYMALCLFDPEHGYYTTREPFGEAGDFTTAPEISQMFGELVAVWCYRAWTAMGAPLPVTLAEIGPGRGTLMRDMLRTLSQIDSSLVASADIALVEASPRLADVQRLTLGPFAGRVTWHAEAGGLKSGQPLIVVANELFDALPIRQFVKAGGEWRERAIVLDEDGGLAFAAGLSRPDASLLPPDAAAAPEGAVVELAPARSAMMASLAQRLAEDGGAGLFIDYGYLEPRTGDTLQALRRHAFDDVLAAPGEADLTAHVDFAALSQIAGSAGLTTETMRQGDFLLGMGLLERAGRLGASMDDAGREQISAAVERLAAPDQMGDLFKVMAVGQPGMSLFPFERNVP